MDMDLNRIIQALKGTIDPKLRIPAETELNQVSEGLLLFLFSPLFFSLPSLSPPTPARDQDPCEATGAPVGSLSFLRALAQTSWTAQRSYETFARGLWVCFLFL